GRGRQHGRCDDDGQVARSAGEHSGRAAGQVERRSVTSDAALRASGIWARIGELEVLRGIDLEVRAGSVVGLLGPSGAGKSTLFRALAGEIAPSRGGVFIAGKEVSRWPLWRRARAGLGYVPQTPSVLVDLS